MIVIFLNVNSLYGINYLVSRRGLDKLSTAMVADIALFATTATILTDLGGSTGWTFHYFVHYFVA